MKKIKKLAAFVMKVKEKKTTEGEKPLEKDYKLELGEGVLTVHLNDAVYEDGESSDVNSDIGKLLKTADENGNMVTKLIVDGVPKGSLEDIFAARIINNIDYRNCYRKITTIDLNGLDTSNVTNMNGMFLDCSGLTKLDVSGFDTSNVTNMGVCLIVVAN